MWVIKVYFGNGSKYTGYTIKRCYFRSTAKRILLRDFRQYFSPSEIRERGKAHYEVFYCNYKEYRK